MEPQIIVELAETIDQHFESLFPESRLDKELNHWTCLKL